MSVRFNKPPGWPAPPEGWEPAPGWAPDPSWPPAPVGWQLWIHEPDFIELDLSATMTTPGASFGPGRAPVTSLTNTVFGIGTPAHATRRPAGPGLTRSLGWGVLGAAVLAAAAVTVGGLAGPPASSPAEAVSRTPNSNSTAGDSTDRILNRAASGTPLAVLAELTVRRRGSSAGYDRTRFGSVRADTDGNGCDQRNDVLRRDLTGKTLLAGTNGCTVQTGTLHDPYTGNDIRYVRSRGNQVHIDHVVSLGDAWTKGARTWTLSERAQFATDPLNLLAVGANETIGKRAGDATRWLPEATDYHCAYVARQVAVKRKYGIWVTAPERATIAQVLTSCEHLPLPTADLITLGGAPLAEPSGAPVTATLAQPRRRHIKELEELSLQAGR